MPRFETPTAFSLPKPPPVAVVVSRYNAAITDELLAAAMQAYRHAGGRAAAVTVVQAPGAFELVPLVHAAARCGRFAGVVALGCIIKGETRHDEYLAHAVAHGLAHVAITTGIPVSLGVLTVDNIRQARDRAGGSHGNKGEEAMLALLQTIAEIRGLTTARPRPAARRPARPKGRR